MFHKILICSGDSFKALRHAMKELAYEARMERGFVLTQNEPSLIEGTYYYVKTEKVEDIDRKTLKTIEGKRERLAKGWFKLDLKRGLVMARNREILSALFEACDAMPDVGLEFADLCLNLKDYVFELQHAYNKSEIKSLKLKDYLCRENMVATGTFKMLDGREGEQLMEKFSDQLEGVNVAFRLPEGKVSAFAGKRGELRFGDGAPQELIDYATDQLMRFHEAEIETAEVRDPVAM